jgi:hypothetical protein
MNQISRHSMAPPIRPPIFFRIAVGLFVTLILFGAAVALFLVYERKSISTAGGWGYLMGAFVFGVGGFFACVAGVVCTALSLWRGEAHRRLSIALLIISSLVVWTLRRVPLVLVRLLLPHE